MLDNTDPILIAADKLVALYERPFGGKSSGRYRLALTLLRQLTGRRRLYEADLLALQRALFERGFVLIDMDSYFVVMSANTFTNYRRVNEDCLT